MEHATFNLEVRVAREVVVVFVVTTLVCRWSPAYVDVVDVIYLSVV
jgi:hypothetical protein